ncbi:WG repeat-containing protein [Pedobacter sp. BS3]|uniref:WG repeat-containing protein n=1 Tax=Pedobacter sp. BS3 TaxID=2567937 RepID=UPI0018D79E0E|nr:WG repeat-containing protein [Pedobacter sp. BS3]
MPVIPFKYEDADVNGFSGGLAPVKLNGKWGYVDTTGKEVIPFIYDLAYYFKKDGKAKVMLNGNWIYIDKTGKEMK